MKEAQCIASIEEPARAFAAVNVAFDSPARRLQQELERAMSGAGEQRWSARRSLGFIVLTNGAVWIALIWTIRAALS
jgi:hypothetical protein